MNASSPAEDDGVLRRLLDGVEGWLPLPEAHFLRDLERAAGADIVEIGCYRGRSTIALCCGALASGQLVHSVDPHPSATGVYGGKFGPEDREVYYRNLLGAGIAKQASLINLTSAQVGQCWQAPVGLLFLDGDHSYNAVRRDIDIWGAHLVASGIAAFDDARDPEGGPGKVIAELTADGRYASFAVVGKIHALRKLDLDGVH
jgi:hypothetical protein